MGDCCPRACTDPKFWAGHPEGGPLMDHNCPSYSPRFKARVALEALRRERGHAAIFLTPHLTGEVVSRWRRPSVQAATDVFKGPPFFSWKLLWLFARSVQNDAIPERMLPLYRRERRSWLTRRVGVVRTNQPGEESNAELGKHHSCH